MKKLCIFFCLVFAGFGKECMTMQKIKKALPLAQNNKKTFSKNVIKKCSTIAQTSGVIVAGLTPLGVMCRTMKINGTLGDDEAKMVALAFWVQ